MKKKHLKKLFGISLKARTLRAWQKGIESGERIISEREALILELIYEFSKYKTITESLICKVLVVNPSSANAIVSKLSKLEFIQKKSDGKGHMRNKPLLITEKGEKALEKIRLSGAARFAYLFEFITDDADWDILMGLFERIDAAATKAVRKNIFGEHELDFEDENQFLENQ